MKRITLLFSILILTVGCMAQKISLSKFATIDAPKGMTKASEKELSGELAQRFSNSVRMSATLNEHGDKIYLKDNMMVFFNSGKIERDPGYLKRHRIGTDYYRKKAEPSKMEKIAGKDVYLRIDVTEGLNLYRFTTINANEDVVVEGFVQFNSPDRDNAYNLIVELIRGLKFDK